MMLPNALRSLCGFPDASPAVPPSLVSGTLARVRSRASAPPPARIVAGAEAGIPASAGGRPGFRSLASDLARALDPVIFAEAAGITPDPWQADVLRSPARQLLLNCCRQSGKSTVTAALAVHTAVYRPGSLVMLFAPSQRQSLELFRKVAGFYRVAGTVDPEAESAQRLELPNGSRLVALPGNPETVRGFSAPSLVIVDEAAFTTNELAFAVRPMLATSPGGRFVAMSTPFGRRGWFHDAWSDGGDDWQRIRITAHECPRITPDFLDSERRNLPPHRFASEYECAFVDTDDAVFPSDLVAAAIRADLPALFPEFRW
jgi:hypothetical protein